jgi:hypothetical protein
LSIEEGSQQGTVAPWNQKDLKCCLALRCCDRQVQTYNNSRRKKLTNDRFVFSRLLDFFSFKYQGSLKKFRLIGSGS